MWIRNEIMEMVLVIFGGICSGGGLDVGGDCIWGRIMSLL
jgi:hypothetical protein